MIPRYSVAHSYYYTNSQTQPFAVRIRPMIVPYLVPSVCYYYNLRHGRFIEDQLTQRQQQQQQQRRQRQQKKKQFGDTEFSRGKCYWSNRSELMTREY